MADDVKKYCLKIYDNFRHGAEEDAFISGNFETYEEAEAKAQSIIDDFIKKNLDRGEKPNKLLWTWKVVGQNPKVISKEDGAIAQFSATAYLNLKIREALEKQKKEWKSKRSTKQL